MLIDRRDDRILYGSSQFLLLMFRSRDRGASLDLIGEGIAEANDPTRINFIAPIQLDPDDQDTLYAGGLSLWRARNASTGTPPDWRTVRPPGTEPIYHFSIAETDSNVLWLGQNDGRIFRTTNARSASPSWVAVEGEAGIDALPNRVPTRVQVSRHDPRSAYVSFGGFERDNLWRTRNDGATWQEISGPLPATPIEAFAEHPLFPDWLYAGTSVGLFTSTDGGASWSSDNGAPANVLVRDLQFAPDTTNLVLGSYGRGFFTADTPGNDCEGGDPALCLAKNRFDVRVSWRDFEGNRGTGHAGALTPDTGTYWFFDPSNLELVVKVLDACSFADSFWVFAAGLTNVEVTIEVTDTLTGATRRYQNPLGATFQPIQDTSAFDTCDADAASPAAEDRLARLARERSTIAPHTQPRPTVIDRVGRAAQSSGNCVGSPSTLCLSDGRFRVEASWDDARDSGTAQGVPLSGDTGYLWFFSEDNVELLVKVLDACNFSSTFFVFAGGLTNVGVELTVTDTVSGQTRTYRNPVGSPFQPIQDTSTFDACG